jgi:hypothetical protein
MLERPEKKTPPDRAREGVTGIEPAACLVYLGRWTHVVDVEATSTSYTMQPVCQQRVAEPFPRFVNSLAP